MGVASVHHDISFLKQGRKTLQHCVGGRSCFDHQQDLARTGEHPYELFQRVGRDDLLPCAVFFDESTCAFRCPIVDRNRDPSALHVQNQVLTHHRKPDDPKVSTVHVITSQGGKSGRARSNRSLSSASYRSA